MLLFSLHLIFLTLGVLVSCQGPSPRLTYWIDESCHQDNRNIVVEDAIDDAINWAQSGAQRLMHNQDKQQEEYFYRLFMPRIYNPPDKFNKAKQKVLSMLKMTSVSKPYLTVLI